MFKNKKTAILIALAALLCAGSGLFAATYNSYVQCRCSQPNEPGTNYSVTTCCGDQYYAAANPSKCTSCPTLCNLNGTNGVGGWVVSSATVSTDCQKCCGTGWSINGMDSNTTCNGTTYLMCHCKGATPTLSAGTVMVSDGQGSCSPGYADAQARNYFGIPLGSAPYTVPYCNSANPHGTINTDWVSQCKTEFPYLVGSGVGTYGICYVGGGNSEVHGMTTCTNVGEKYYLGCVMK